MNILTANLVALKNHYPALWNKLQLIDTSKVRVTTTPDGGISYGIDNNGHIIHLSDPKTPLARIEEQLRQNMQILGDFTRPVLIVGLYPGTELIYIFNLSENDHTPHAEQHIYVCIDSLECLHGFLQSIDVQAIIQSKRVHLFWQSDTADLVNQLKQNPEIPHIFSLITGSTNDILNVIMPHFANFVAERNADTERLITANNAYYDIIDDDALANIIDSAGKPGNMRQPRLMIPTCSWSNVTQFSAETTCALFEQAGWATKRLNMDTMLTPFYLAKQINDFKPDIFLFINHLRSEALDFYPANMMFISWIQDSIPWINSSKTAQTWTSMAQSINPSTNTQRRRDLLIGYVDQLLKYGYPRDRLQYVNMIIDTDKFKPGIITQEQHKKYDCDVCFASNRSKPAYLVIQQDLLPSLSPYKFKLAHLTLINNHLSTLYQNGKTITSYHKLEEELNRIPEIGTMLSKLNATDYDQVVQKIFWQLNDVIYRHTVLEWCDEIGIKLNLYGNGWNDHPILGKHAKGPLPYGSELNAAYQCAKHCLHLNSTEGTHQRIQEIIAAGAQLLTRHSDTHTNEALLSAMAKAGPDLINPQIAGKKNSTATLSKDENDALCAHISHLLTASEINNMPADIPLYSKILLILRNEYTRTPALFVNNWNEATFKDKDDLIQKLSKNDINLSNQTLTPIENLI